MQEQLHQRLPLVGVGRMSRAHKAWGLDGEREQRHERPQLCIRRRDRLPLDDVLQAREDRGAEPLVVVPDSGISLTM